MSTNELCKNIIVGLIVGLIDDKTKGKTLLALRDDIQSLVKLRNEHLILGNRGTRHYRLQVSIDHQKVYNHLKLIGKLDFEWKHIRDHTWLEFRNGTAIETGPIEVTFGYRKIWCYPQSVVFMMDLAMLHQLIADQEMLDKYF